MGPRRGVRVPAPAEKQGLRADRDDSVHAVGVVRPAGGDEGVPRVSRPSDLLRRGWGTQLGRLAAVPGYPERGIVTWTGVASSVATAAH